MLKYYPIVICFICHFIPETLLFTSYTVEYVKFLNETSKVPGYGNATLKRTGRNYPKIFAEFEITDNIKNYDVEMKAFYSPLGNTRYILLPFKIYRQPICKVLNSEYRNRFMHDLHKYSNWPFSEDRKIDLCDLMPVGQYYWRNYTADKSTLISSTPPGRYRVLVLFYKRSERISCKGLEFLSLFT